MLISGFRTLLLSTIALLSTAVASLATTSNITVKVTTPVGNMTLELYGDAKPITVTNFLHYIRDGLYTNSIAHRLPQGFVLQGGAVYLDQNGQLNYLSTYPAITNEPGPFPQYSNIKGTIAMAKVSGEPNSATGSWFINLKDNNTGTAEDGNLDLLNGGFTVFGRVIDVDGSLAVLQKFIDFKNQQFDANKNPIDGTNLIVNLDDGVLSDLPFTSVTGGQLSTDNLVTTGWTIVDGPTPIITSPSAVYVASAATFSYQISATGSPTTYSITGDSLPAGLSLNPSTGLISGTLSATAPASLNLTLKATNVDGTGSASLSLGINYPIIAAGVKVTGTLGKPFRYQIAATNSPTQYAASGLPSGLSINPTTGLISGTPTAAGGPINVSVSAGNIAATYNATLIITIEMPPAPNFTVSPKIKIKDGVLTLKGAAAAEAVKLEVKVGKKGFKKVKGKLTHWSFPVRIFKPGNYKFQVRATDVYGQTSTRSFSLRIGG